MFQLHIYFVFRMVAQVTRLPHNVDPEYLGLQTYTVTTRIISLQVLWLISHKPPLFILLVHRGFPEILRIKRSFFAIGRVLNESQGSSMDRKSLQVQICPLYGQIWPCIFFHSVKQKVDPKITQKLLIFE